MHHPSAEFSDRFQPKGKSCKTFDIIMLTKSVSLILNVWWGCRLDTWHPHSPI